MFWKTISPLIKGSLIQCNVFGRHTNCNEFAKAVGHYVCSKILLFRAELKLRGYYLEHDFYLDRVIFTNMSHVYYLNQ